MYKVIQTVYRGLLYHTVSGNEVDIVGYYLENKETGQSKYFTADEADIYDIDNWTGDRAVPISDGFLVKLQTVKRVGIGDMSNAFKKLVSSCYLD